MNSNEGINDLIPKVLKTEPKGKEPGKAKTEPGKTKAPAPKGKTKKSGVTPLTKKDFPDAQIFNPKKNAKELTAEIGKARKAGSITIQEASNLIRERRSHEIDVLIETGTDDGMIDLDRYLAGLVRSGIVARDVAMQFVRRRGLFERLI